jgi:hypothetical protein
LAGCCGLVQAQNPYVAFSPESLGLSSDAGATAPLTAKVRMANSGNAFSFGVTTNQSWLSVSPVSGFVGTAGFLDFTVTVDVSQFTPGTYTGRVTVIPNADTGLPSTSFDVQVTRSGVSFLVDPPSLDLVVGPDGTDTRLVNVTVSDASFRALEVTPFTGGTGNWLSIVTQPPITAPQTISVRASGNGLDIGTSLSGEIRLSSPSLPGYVKTIPVTLTVIDRTPGITLVPSLMNFYVFGTQPPAPQFVQVTAGGDRSLPFSVSQTQGGSSINTSVSQAIAPTTFTVSVNQSQLVELPHQAALTFAPGAGLSDVILPVTTSTEAVRVYSLPQVADGGDFRTAITVVNNHTAASTVSLRFYKSDPVTHTTTAWNPAMDGNAKVENVQIASLGSWTVQTSGADSAVSSGWAEVVCSDCGPLHSGLSGLAVFRQLRPGGGLQEAAVPINSIPMQRHLLAYDNTNGNVTSMAIANLSQTEVARVRVAFRDPSGRLLKVDRVKDIPARGHFAFALESEFPFLQGQRGTADFWILSGNISVLGLRFSPSGAFTSFEAQSLNRRPAGRRSIPQVADGGDFRTSITLVNNDASPARVRLKLYRETGSGNATLPWTVAFRDGVNPDAIDIAPGSTVTVESAGTSPVVQSGWAEVVSDALVTGFAVFRQTGTGGPPQEAAVPINAGTPLRALLPFDNTNGFLATMALANLSDSSAAVTNLVFRDIQGNRLYQTQINIPPLGHTAVAMQTFSDLLINARGTLEVSAISGEVSAMGLRFAPSGAYTSFKAQPLQ